MEGRVEPLLEPESSTLTGLFLITDDGNSISPQLAQLLEQKGASTAILNSSMLLDPDQLAKQVIGWREQLGPVKGIIHLASLVAIPLPEFISDWRKSSQIQAKSLFNLLQLSGEDLRQYGGQVLAGSLLGGQWGRNGNCSPGLPLQGASSGLLKTMTIEWPEVRAKVIDFDNFNRADIATNLVKELLSQDRNAEIGYCQGKRLVFDVVPAPLFGDREERIKPGVHLADDSVVLSIGGARGITAEIVSELIRPGMTLILVGRSALLGEESGSTQGIDDISFLRRTFLEEALSQGSKPTPVQIENRVRQLQRDRAIRGNLEKFRQAGVHVEYHAVDVKDPDQFGSLIETLYTRYGRIDAVVQGAGIIQDKLIVDKTPASFEEVFDTKIDSTFILSRHLRPDSLKLIVLFASVAGRTGNRGQCDYAAANEVINRFAWWMKQHWLNTRVIAINWGPWDMVGMASDQVNRQFRERGVIPIPPDAGRQFFKEELLYGEPGDVELIAGSFEGAPKQAMASGSQEYQKGEERGLPLLVSLPLFQPNGTVTMEKTISLSSDPYLTDHRIDGKPVLPAAIALEYLAEIVQAAWSEWVVAQVHDLRVWRGIVLETEAGRNVLFRVRTSTHANSESLQVLGEILDPEKNTPFYRANLILRPKLEEEPESQLPFLNASTGLDLATAYSNYCFHGKLFQLLTSIDCFGTEGAEAQVKPSNSAIWLNRQPSSQNWLFDPGLIDVSLQIALMWTHIHGDIGALPSRFGKVVRYGNSPFPQTLRIVLRVKEFTPTTMVFDALFIDRGGQVRLELEDMENTCSRALNRLAAQ